MAIPTCGTDYINSCLSTAAGSACGGFSDVECICGSAGLGSIGYIMINCLAKSCDPLQGASVANSGYSFCSAFESSHTTLTYGTETITSQSLPVSTTSRSFTTSSSVFITSSPTLSSLAPTSTVVAPSHAPLSSGGKAGIGVGAGVLFILVVAYAFRRWRKQSKGSNSTNRIPGPNSRLDDLSNNRNDFVDNIALEDLNKDKSPSYTSSGHLFEAESRLARAGHPKGKAAGTEATAFDFDNQKVLLEPGLGLPGRPGSDG